MVLKKSVKFTCTIGTTPGYDHNNEEKDIDFIQILKEVCKEQEIISDMYISFVVQSSKCVYKEEWGCPKDGEDAITISAVMNPAFTTNSHAWMLTCTEIMKRLMKRLRQHTVTGEFSNVDMIYEVADHLKDDNKEEEIKTENSIKETKSNIIKDESYDVKYLNNVWIGSAYMFCLVPNTKRIEVCNTKIDYVEAYESLRHIKVLDDGSDIVYKNDAEVSVRYIKDDDFILVYSLFNNEYEDVMLDFKTGIILRNRNCIDLNDVKNEFIEFYKSYIEKLSSAGMLNFAVGDGHSIMYTIADLKRRMEKL